ncbi:MAG: Crp/Fnr family transcriptional regulator [Geminicoccaceae bacterium]
MSPKPGDPIDNRLLARLPADVRERLRPALEPVVFGLGDVVYEVGGQMEHIYFPATSIVSLICTMEEGATAEMGLVGSEGVVGIARFLGGDTTPNQAVVQVAGGALRMTAQAMLEEFRLGGPFQLGLLRYTQALITQISQTAVCNRLHPIEQRLCRWLLMTRNRLPSDEILMTQEFIAHMLGVRREGVTAAAHHLQEAGLIRYRHGHITILDRTGLESATCECYLVVKDEFDRLLGDGWSRDECGGKPLGPSSVPLCHDWRKAHPRARQDD